MEIRRKGTGRDYGWTNVFEDSSPAISADAVTGRVHLEVRAANGIGTEKGGYKYDIALTPEDIGALLGFLGKQRNIFENNKINNQLCAQSQHLLRLLIASSGLPLVLQPSEISVRLAKLKTQGTGEGDRSSCSDTVG